MAILTDAERSTFEDIYSRLYDYACHDRNTSQTWRVALEQTNFLDTGKNAKDWLLEASLLHINPALIKLMVRPRRDEKAGITIKDLAGLGWTPQSKGVYVKLGTSNNPSFKDLVYFGMLRREFNGTRYGTEVRIAEHKRDEDSGIVRGPGYIAELAKAPRDTYTTSFVTAVAFPVSDGYDEPHRRFREALVSHFLEGLLAQWMGTIMGDKRRGDCSAWELSVYKYKPTNFRPPFNEDAVDVGEFLPKPSKEQLKERERENNRVNWAKAPQSTLDRRADYREEHRQEKRQYDRDQAANRTQEDREKRKANHKKNTAKKTDAELADIRARNRIAVNKCAAKRREKKRLAQLAAQAEQKP